MILSQLEHLVFLNDRRLEREFIFRYFFQLLLQNNGASKYHMIRFSQFDLQMQTLAVSFIIF